MGEVSTATFTLEPIPTHPVRSVLLYIAMEAEAVGVADALGLSAPTVLHAHSSARRRDGVHQGIRIQLVTAGGDRLLAVDRIGTIPAALAVTHALDAHPFDLIINTGTAGSFLSRGAAIGDLLFARTVQFHDCRVPLPKFDALSRAFTQLSCNDAELHAITALLPARLGGFSTGSSFDATPEELAHFSREETLAKEMELGAIAIVARERSVPLIALKSVTDFVDGHEPNHEAFLKNLAFASEQLAIAMPKLLAWLSDPLRRREQFA